MSLLRFPSLFQQRILDGNLSFKYKHPSSVSNQIVEKTVKFASSLCWNLRKETMNSHFLGCSGRILSVTLVRPHQEDCVLVPPAKHRRWTSAVEDHRSGSQHPEIWARKCNSNCSWSNPRTPGCPVHSTSCHKRSQWVLRTALMMMMWWWWWWWW